MKIIVDEAGEIIDVLDKALFVQRATLHERFEHRVPNLRFL